jgi:hypothetical protein
MSSYGLLDENTTVSAGRYLYLKVDVLLLLLMRKHISTETSFTVTSSFIFLAITATISIANFSKFLNVITSAIYSDTIPIRASLA